MPTTRRQLQQHSRHFSHSDNQNLTSERPEREDLIIEEDELEEDDEEEDDEDEEQDGDEIPPDLLDAPNEPPSNFPPSCLKEISSLASWTVSTSKPGCGVAALRSPNLIDHFWQSDGPQPHLLSIHFSKLASIVHIRIYLDFERDESYTPTKIQFLAGMSPHDLMEFAEMSFEQPKGWIDVDFGNVGVVDDDEGVDRESAEYWDRRPELRAFLVQVQILENHQNGKDTHLRGLQIFARDKSQVGEKRVKPISELAIRTAKKTNESDTYMVGLKEPAWLMEPELR
ncbi:hypothetical protein LTR04_005974 [Oleoguttula sp. CCFEE 6159]|nr:hypothetical protein LTR04_005974 [Oleoguttula sp. CCFEE 6159]